MSRCFHDKWTSSKLSEHSAQPMGNHHPKAILPGMNHNGVMIVHQQSSKQANTQGVTFKHMGNRGITLQEISMARSQQCTCVICQQLITYTEPRRHPDNPRWTKCPMWVSAEECLKNSDGKRNSLSPPPHTYLIIVLSCNIWFYASTEGLNFILVI